MKIKNQPEERKRERRFLPVRELRVKRTETGQPVIEGYAAVFNSLSEDLGGFREQILPGAFTQSLRNDADVRALFNHDENNILGRTKSKTLELNEDQTGLAFRCLLPDTTVARDLAVSMERGDIDQCSFGFYCMTDDWAMLDGVPVRSVKEAELFDVSAVTYPAYLGTSVAMRSLWKDGKPESIEKALVQLRAEPGKSDNGCDADCENPSCLCSETRGRRDRLRLIRALL